MIFKFKKFFTLFYFFCFLNSLNIYAQNNSVEIDQNETKYSISHSVNQLQFLLEKVHDSSSLDLTDFYYLSNAIHILEYTPFDLQVFFRNVSNLQEYMYFLSGDLSKINNPKLFKLSKEAYKIIYWAATHGKDIVSADRKVKLVNIEDIESFKRRDDIAPLLKEFLGVWLIINKEIIKEDVFDLKKFQYNILSRLFITPNNIKRPKYFFQETIFENSEGEFFYPKPFHKAQFFTILSETVFKATVHGFWLTHRENHSEYNFEKTKNELFEITRKALKSINDLIDYVYTNEALIENEKIFVTEQGVSFSNFLSDQKKIIEGYISLKKSDFYDFLDALPGLSTIFEDYSFSVEPDKEDILKHIKASYRDSGFSEKELEVLSNDFNGLSYLDLIRVKGSISPLAKKEHKLPIKTKTRAR